MTKAIVSYGIDIQVLIKFQEKLESLGETNKSKVVEKLIADYVGIKEESIEKKKCSYCGKIAYGLLWIGKEEKSACYQHYLEFQKKATGYKVLKK
jgi:hypothetical protein